MHKKTITSTLLASILLALTSCGDTGSSAKSFYYRLRGTWESNNTSDYYGTLVITYDRITITGYDQTLWFGMIEDQRPFKGLPKDRAMPGY